MDLVQSIKHTKEELEAIRQYLDQECEAKSGTSASLAFFTEQELRVCVLDVPK